MRALLARFFLHPSKLTVLRAKDDAAVAAADAATDVQAIVEALAPFGQAGSADGQAGSADGQAGSADVASDFASYLTRTNPVLPITPCIPPDAVPVLVRNALDDHNYIGHTYMGHTYNRP